MAHTRRRLAFLALLGTVAVFAACGDANEPPTAGGPIPAQKLVEGDTGAIDLSRHFSDPEGDALSYAASTSGGVVSVSVSGSALTLGALLPGQADGQQEKHPQPPAAGPTGEPGAERDRV